MIIVYLSRGCAVIGAGSEFIQAIRPVGANTLGREGGHTFG